MGQVDKYVDRVQVSLDYFHILTHLPLLAWPHQTDYFWMLSLMLMCVRRGSDSVA